MSRTLPCLLAVAFLSAASCAFAAGVNSLAILDRGAGANFDGNVMAADKHDGDAATNRQLIRTSTTVSLGTGTFRIYLRLRKEGGAVVQQAFYDETIVGAPLPFYGYNHDFDLSGAAQLDPFTDHVIEVEVFQWTLFVPGDPASGFFKSVAVRTSEAHRWRHFTNTASNDAPLNVIAELTSSSVHLVHAAAGYALSCTTTSHFWRFDRFNEVLPARDFVRAEVQFSLTRVDTGANIALANALQPLDQLIGLDGYTHPAGEPKSPSEGAHAQTFTVTLAPGAAFDPTAHAYALTAQLRFGPAVGGLLAANSVEVTPTTMEVDFPPGSGWASSPRDCVLQPSLSFALPAGENEWRSVANNLWIMEESRPVMFFAASVFWNPATQSMRFAGGQARGVRRQWLNDLTLVKDDLDNAMKDVKRSNDHAFNGANAAQGNVMIDYEGGLDASVTLVPSSFRTHFPYNVVVTSQSGTVDITDDEIDPDSSSLKEVSPLSVPYSKLCASCATGADPNPVFLPLQPTGGILQFTADGGLRGSGLTPNAAALAWGRAPGGQMDAHSLDDTFDDAVFLMAGQRLVGSLGADDLGPARLLLSGFKALANGALTAERPGTVEYGVGAGDYAGLNFRCVANGAFHATSNLAGDTFANYAL
ncbi:MAG: hypothetical protein ACOYMN_21485, partial [Roseimicrobium sp.]